MAQTNRHGNYSIQKDRDNWLKQQKRETGLPESHFVNKGLDLVIGTEEINAIKLMITPAVFFLLGTILFLFGVFFSDTLPVPVLIIILLSGIVIVSLSWFGLYKSIKVWNKIKKVTKEIEKNDRGINDFSDS
jgi:hypothetical protein